MMNNKKDFFSTVFCIFIAALFILGCNNYLLKTHQDEARLIVQIANSTGARNASTTGDWQISARIEHRDGSQSHHQNLNSASGEEASLTFDDLVIGSQINIHLELTKNDDSQTKLTGESGWITVKEGEQVIKIPLESQANTDDSGEGNGSTSDGETEGDEPAIVDAETPVIGEITSTIKTYTSDPESVTATLKADASVADGGTLTYQWYSSDSPTTDSGTAIEGATNATYEAKVDAGKTKYFYCIVTNTNDNVNGNKTASATSNIATVASIEGELTSITARYTGTYELVNTVNYSNIEIEQTYTVGSETQVVTVQAEESKYSIELQENTIGNVPATVTHVETKKETTVTIPVKYELDASNLSISGDSSVEQNEELKLTAEYKVDGNDSYNLYTSPDSSDSYKIIENVTISWTSATAQSDDTWKATADTTSTGQNTATVTLTSTDDTWCVTTGGITASHEYEVIPLVNAEIPTITQEPKEKTEIFVPEQAVEQELTVVATVSDGGVLTYQWYSNTTNSTENGTHIEGATSATYEAKVEAGTTKYFYCVVTNTNDNVNGNKTASVTSKVVPVASIVGQLDSITAQYRGSTYELVNSEINYSNIQIQQTYIADSETQVVTVSAEEEKYSIDLPTNAIGNVLATVIHTGTKKETTVTIPVKYQLDKNNLRITGSTSVDQNGTLSLTANYADDSGSDITYQKYDGENRTTYNVKDNVTIAWTSATAQSDDTWKATANTQTTGQNTATVTLTSTDDTWCVTTEGITASHEYEVIPLVNAKSPTITQEPEGQIQIFATGKTDSVKKILAVAAEVDDGGDLTYQWYSNTTNSTENGIQIENATNATYEAQVAAKETKYFYCVVTNTNDNVNGTKTASVTSDVVTVASIEGTLTGITAQYAGSQEYILVENSNFDGFTVTETYTGNGQTITNQVTSLDGQYNVTKPENAIGYVPVTITNSSKPEITTTVDIPVKYQLDKNNLRITGSTSVDQNGTLSLTANYADDSGSDITYQKYDGESSTTYNVKDNVTIAWTSATAQSDDTWKATANTQTTGQNTATVTLTPKDEWCVTEKIEKPHEYTVLALGSQDNPVTTWEQLTSAIASTTNPIYVDTNSMEATSTIEITGTTEIIPLQNLTITGSGRFFTIGDTASLTLGNDNFEIVLDGTAEQSTEPILFTSGTLTLNGVEVKNRENTNIASSGGICIYSGETTLNNVSFSGNTSGLSGAADIYLHQGKSQAQLNLAESFASTEIYFSAAMSETTYPVIQLNQNLSLQDANKVKITVGSTTPENIQVVNKNGYTGDLNTLFTIVGSDGTSYSLDEEGKIVENTQSSIPENGLSWDSSTSYLTIYNEQGLKNFRDIVNGTVTQAIIVGEKTFSGQDRTVKATLANDIILTSSEDWTPIGVSGSYTGYAGTFDGAGRKISGIKITSGSNRGFFGQIESQAIITGLTVGGSITASTNTGGIVGIAAGGRIEYCVNDITITSTSDYVGGIVGVSQGSTTITGCVNLAPITGNNYIGGILGYSSSSYAATIDKCINIGSINSSNTNRPYTGGIQGYSSVSSNKITNSLNLGTINNSDGKGAGIICNDASLTIQYCLSAGTISASSQYAVASSTSGTQTKNYYDSSKITQTQSQASGNAGRATSDLKVASPWDTSWTTTNWSFAAGRYPVPNIQGNIPSDIWKDIVEKAQQ